MPLYRTTLKCSINQDPSWSAESVTKPTHPQQDAQVGYDVIVPLDKMSSSVSSWVVLVYHVDHEAHAAHFPTMDHAEDFANTVRVASSLCVSEPLPVAPVAKLTALAIKERCWAPANALVLKLQMRHAILWIAFFLSSGCCIKRIRPWGIAYQMERVRHTYQSFCIVSNCIRNWVRQDK